jgi:uncharacterized protein (TIGR02270 family)
MGARGTYLPKVFEQHLSAVALVWARRRGALRSPAYTGEDVLEVDQLIEAHFDGLIAAGEDSIPLLESELGGDALRAFASASTLLRVGTPDSLARVVDAFRSATGIKLDALRDALAHGPASALHSQLMSFFLSAPPNVGAAAGEVLAFHGGFAPGAEHIARFLRSEDPSARAGGWRIAAYCRLPIGNEWYDAGLRDDDADARRAALQAAAWNGSPSFSAYCRDLIARPTPESIEPLVMMAAVAPPEDYQAIESIGSNAALGPGRYRVVAAFGHPYFIDFLLREMENPDAVAVASAAFEKMTGRHAEDAGQALKQWHEVAPRLAHSSRICRGVDVSSSLERGAFSLLDRESAWEFCLRARLTNGWSGTPLTLERFPQRG